MLKRCFHLFAYLLLVIMPLQGMAATSGFACEQLMRAQTQTPVNQMPCHQHMANPGNQHIDADDVNYHNTDHNKHCKNICSALCATLCAAALPGNTYSAITPNVSQLTGLTQQTYTSVVLPGTQRPPIFLA